jgi:hypothetical protein
VGRLFKYDVTGGRYEETDYFAQGSGGKDARDSLKKRFKRDLPKDEAVRVAIEALMDAADEDLGTGGPDLQRGIYPTVRTITRSGFAEIARQQWLDQRSQGAATEITRTINPGDCRLASFCFASFRLWLRRVMCTVRRARCQSVASGRRTRVLVGRQVRDRCLCLG